MIAPGTRFIGPVRVPLELLTVAPQAIYYPDVVERYRQRLTDPEHPGDDVLIYVEPCGWSDTQDAPNMPILRVVDGRHRYLASILAGRRDLQALIEIPPDASTCVDAMIRQALAPYRHPPSSSEARPQAAREAVPNGRHERATERVTTG